MAEAGQGQILGPAPAAGVIGPLDDRHRQAGCGQGHRGREPVGPGPHHHHIHRAQGRVPSPPWVFIHEVLPPGVVAPHIGPGRGDRTTGGSCTGRRPGEAANPAGNRYPSEGCGRGTAGPGVIPDERRKSLIGWAINHRTGVGTMDMLESEEANSGQVSQMDSEQVEFRAGGRAGGGAGRGRPGRPGRSEGHGPTPGDVLRTLPSEAQQRGTRFVSAQAMQAKLFSVYDAAAAAEDALALVQQQLTLTLNRNYYEADEIESMAAELDALLMLESLDLSEEDLVSEG